MSEGMATPEATEKHAPARGAATRGDDARRARRRLEIADRLADTNINPTTFLATDYLNHFNEAVMLLELVPDMPEMLEDARAWRPKSYQEHFRDSDFAAKELACEAYEHAPDRFRLPFDLTVRTINRSILSAIDEIAAAAGSGDGARLGEAAATACGTIKELIAAASAIINGNDQVFREHRARSQAPAEGSQVMAQSDIDALFD